MSLRWLHEPVRGTYVYALRVGLLDPTLPVPAIRSTSGGHLVGLLHTEVACAEDGTLVCVPAAALAEDNEWCPACTPRVEPLRDAFTPAEAELLGWLRAVREAVDGAEADLGAGTVGQRRVRLTQLAVLDAIGLGLVPDRFTALVGGARRDLADALARSRAEFVAVRSDAPDREAWVVVVDGYLLRPLLVGNPRCPNPDSASGLVARIGAAGGVVAVVRAGGPGQQLLARTVRYPSGELFGVRVLDVDPAASLAAVRAAVELRGADDADLGDVVAAMGAAALPG